MRKVVDILRERYWRRYILCEQIVAAGVEDLEIIEAIVRTVESGRCGFGGHSIAEGRDERRPLTVF